MAEQRHIRVQRARAQAIGGGVRCGGVAEVLARVVGVQAQDPASAALGVRARSVGLTAGDVRWAVENRVAVRGWFMRGTLHLVAASDVRRLLDLLGPVFLRSGERRLRELGLDPKLCARAERLIGLAIAADGPLTRAELTERLGTLGVPTEGQAAFHLIRRSALAGQICYGPEGDGPAARARFALLDAWLPADGRLPWEGEAAVVELARRYRAGYGPSEAQDFATWSGLPMPAAKRAWAAAASDLPDAKSDAEGEDAAEAGDVRLLPAYDNYLTAYRSRELSVPAAHERQVWPGGGQIRASIVVDGWAVGTWSCGVKGSAGVMVSPFGALSAGVEDGVAAEAADIDRFLARG
ncbi:winged helix DNA-binding domain-containing protein [Streptomyces syringium]|uniref:winged helix DNA-binding domain-containing protein n=1 Tax=Streptomyces syringium TaxID=76729 RepID=UPI003AAF9000